MAKQPEKETLLDRDLARIVDIARSPTAPPLPADFGQILALRVSRAEPAPSNLPQLAAGISAFCLLVLAVFSFHSGMPQELRLLAGTAVAANIVLGPLATLAIVLFLRRDSHAKA